MTATQPSHGVAVDPGTARRLVERAKAITERELARYRERTAGSQAATARARKVLPLGVPSSFQAYDPHPIVVRHASGRPHGRRRRQRVRRLRHGLRRPLRRSHAPGGAGGRAGPARRRHAVRDAVRARRRGRRAAGRPLRAADVALHQLGHRGDDGRHPRGQGVDRPRPHRQGRGRLPRPPRRGDGVDEAAARPRRPGRRAGRRAGHGGAHQGRPRRHDRDPVQRPGGARAGARRRRRRLLHRRAGDGEHRHLPARRRLPAGGARDHRARTARC